MDQGQRRHQCRAVSAEQTTSSPTPREPLTSTTSPGRTNSRTSDAACAAVASAAQAAPLVRELVRPGDVVLVKGSRGVGLEVVCSALTARH